MKRVSFSHGFLVLGCLLMFLGLGTQYVQAAGNAYNDGLYGSCTYDACPLTLTTSTTVNANVLPTPSTTCSTQSDAVGVTTDSSTGYTLTLKDSDTNNSLVNGGSSISAVSGSQSSPVALTANKWGYRVDGLGGFGAGPTSASSNVPPTSTTFALVPLSSSTADTLATTTSPADPTVTTTVWYGVCADTTIPAGTYSDNVTYTAVIN